MQLTLRTKNRKLSPREEELIRKKIDRLRHLDQVSDAEVVVSQERNKRGDMQIIQLTLHAHGALLRSEESDTELNNALDAALAKIDTRLERYKGRWVRRRKSHSDRDTLPVVLDGVEATDDEGDEEDDLEAARPVVRTKRFAVQPMTKEEAVEQMELLGHSFFIYWDADDKLYAVVYRRHSGDYGVLQPELAS
jgi:putative sigma-54 modulation protein